MMSPAQPGALLSRRAVVLRQQHADNATSSATGFASAAITADSTDRPPRLAYPQMQQVTASHTHTPAPQRQTDGHTAHSSDALPAPAPMTPSAARALSAAAVPLVKLEAVLPPQLRHVLPYEHLNRVQSAVFDVAMHSNSSIALAAPTGCGKTGVFELAMLRLIAQRAGHSNGGDTGSSTATSSGGTPTSGSKHNPQAHGKVLYLSPLRALCAEKKAEWTAKFKPLGLRVALCTGDVDGFGGGGGGPFDGTATGGAGAADDDADDGLSGGGDSLAAVRAADIIVATPEKWDALTRRWRDNVGLIGSIALVCIDEVHTLAETRGGVLEAIVSRMRAVSAAPAIAERSWPAAHMRFVAVSATLPNLRDVGQWIGAGLDTTFNFDDSFRPVPLHVHVLGYECK